LADNDSPNLRGLIRKTNFWASAATIFFILIGMLLFLIGYFDSDYFLIYLIALLALPFQVLSSLRQAILRGLGKIAYALTPEFIVKPLIFIVILSALFWFSNSVSVYSALIINFTAVLTAFILGMIWQRKFIPSEIFTLKPTYQSKEWLKVALPLLVIVGLNLMSTRIGLVMLGMISGPEASGVYAAASRVADIIIFGLVSANAIMAPMIARLFSSGNREELQKVVSMAAKGVALFTLPISLIVIIFGRQILGAFGAEFQSGYPVLVILVLGQTVNSLAGPVGYLMTMTGHQNLAVKITAFVAISNLLLNLYLIPILGGLGAAISTASSIIILNVILLLFVKKKLGLNSSIINFVRQKT